LLVSPAIVADLDLVVRRGREIRCDRVRAEEVGVEQGVEVAAALRRWA
jgi:hypothetical protein